MPSMADSSEARLAEVNLGAAHLERPKLRWAQLKGANLAAVCLKLPTQEQHKKQERNHS